MKKQRLMELANLKKEEYNEDTDVVFMIDNGNLNDMFLDSKYANSLDYLDIKGDSFYVLPRKMFDSFVDLAISSGYNEPEDISEVDSTGKPIYDGLEETKKYSKLRKFIRTEIKKLKK